MVTSPAIGAYLGQLYGDGLVVALATAVAVLDVLFILVVVPESLSETRHPEAYHLQLSQISWEKADPFGVSSHVINELNEVCVIYQVFERLLVHRTGKLLAKNIQCYLFFCASCMA
jgi:hypothetical protein